MEKHIYVLLVVLVIVILFVIFRYFSNDYIQYTKQNPYLIKGIMPNITKMNISSNKINKSIDRRNGMEFTYAFWMKINQIPTTKQTIFVKGSNITDFKENCPGVYITNNNYNDELIQHSNDIGNIDNSKDMGTIDMIINIDTYDIYPDCESNIINERLKPGDIGNKEICKRNNCDYDDTNDNCKRYDCSTLNYDTKTNSNPYCEDVYYCSLIKNDDESTKCESKRNEVCIIKNIPYKKWFHTTIILVNHYLDVYINGNLYERFEIKGVPKQNNSNLIIGGEESNIPPANASIGNLQYFNRAIPYYKIHKMMERNNVENSKTLSENEDEPPYLDDKYWIGENTLNKYEKNY